jgi:hypothetical protein
MMNARNGCIENFNLEEIRYLSFMIVFTTPFLYYVG